MARCVWILRILGPLHKSNLGDSHPMQMGEVLETSADIDKSRKILKFQPKVSIEQGLVKFIEWYREYYSIKNY